MTNKTKFGAAVLLCATVGGWSGAALADHFSGACASELNATEFAIQTANFLGRNAATDRTNLLAKLQAAGAKVGLNKYSDAVDKLQNISDTATALANAPKPKLADASGISTAVVAAISCVGAL